MVDRESRQNTTHLGEKFASGVDQGPKTQRRPGPENTVATPGGVKWEIWMGPKTQRRRPRTKILLGAMPRGVKLEIGLLTGDLLKLNDSGRKKDEATIWVFKFGLGSMLASLA